MILRRSWALAGLWLLSLASCDRREVVLFEEVPPGPLAGIRRIEIRPSMATTVADGRTPPVAVVFQAIGVFENEERDISDRATWKVSAPALGTIGAGVFQAGGTVGGDGTIGAEVGDLEAEASVRVTLAVSSIDPSAPSDAPSFFPENVSGDQLGSDLRTIYPSDGTVFPPNVSRTLFQWRAPVDTNLYEVRFDSALATVRHYTRDKSFALDELSRNWLPRTHAGRSVTMTVRSVSSTSTGTVHRSSPIELRYADTEVRGAIYYWSTGARGIMRATLDGPAAVTFFPGEDEERCASCHTVSRDGRLLAAGYEGEKLRVVSLPERTVLEPNAGESERSYGWGSFDPTGRRLLISHKGDLSLLELESGASSQVSLPDGLHATHPDWSPDGRQIALAVSEKSTGNKEAEKTSLARLLVQADGSFGALEILLSNEGDEDTLAFPSHSPDGRWLAFVRAQGKSKDNPSAEISIIRADGTGSPIVLETLNRVVRDQPRVTSIGNSMPTWAPRGSGDLDWIAFSSLRAYGDVALDPKRDQLWAAAIDLSRAASGLDPSAPAFWLPFQQTEEGNHRAFWSSNPDDACPSTIEICNGIDDDCDGVTDNDCCTPVEEVCGDGLDNDCDRARDEGCGCAPSESCGNGLDDDCDGLTDLEDEDCAL